MGAFVRRGETVTVYKETVETAVGLDGGSRTLMGGLVEC